MLRTIFPPLDYPLTRPFQWKWITPTAYALALVVALIVCLLNVALVGYDAVTEVNNEFNTTGPPHWFDRFVPAALTRRKPGTLCNPRVFNVGESLVTNNSFFNWRVAAAVMVNVDGSGYSYTYKGEPLENCDVSQIEFVADLRTWSLDSAVYINCLPPDEDNVLEGRALAGVTTFGVSVLPAKNTAGLFADSASAEALQYLLRETGLGVVEQMNRTFAASNADGVTTFSILADFEFCPTSHSRDPSTTCAQSFNRPPNITEYTAFGVAGNGIARHVNGSFDPALHVPALDFLHLVHSVARIDIGNTAPNNFLTNMDMVNATLAVNFPAPIGAPEGSTPIPSILYRTWTQNGSAIIERSPELRVPSPAILETVFICRFLKIKSTGSLIISVLVATQSIFFTIWAVGILVATFFAKRDNPRASYCEGCTDAESHTHDHGVSGEKMGSPDSQGLTVGKPPATHNHSKA